MPNKAKNIQGSVINNKASALLIALIAMGILMTLALGVSEILMDTMKDSRLLLEKTRAWYAAESGLERALFAIAQNPPGFEEQKNSNLQTPGVKYEYQIAATSSEIPLKAAYEIESDKDKYAELGLNESVTIPLFRGSEPENTVKNLRVDYYFAPDLQLRGAYVDNDLDILRWKIFGIANDGKMEVINEFVPANQGNSADSPTCIGTPPDCYNGAKFYQRRLGTDGALEYHIVKKYPISTFLNEHTQNFLVLTNMVNVDLIAGAISTNDKKKIANIRYRVVDEDNKKNLTLPSIKIMSDGYAGSAKQSLNLEIKRESFLPVFNYALYRTAE